MMQLLKRLCTLTQQPSKAKFQSQLRTRANSIRLYTASEKLKNEGIREEIENRTKTKEIKKNKAKTIVLDSLVDDSEFQELAENESSKEEIEYGSKTKGKKKKEATPKANPVKVKVLDNLVDDPEFQELNETESSKEEIEDDSKTKVNKKMESKPKANLVLDSLLNEPGFQELKDLIPDRLLIRKRTSPDALYLINKDIAHDILIPILPYLRTEAAINSSLIEINPGFGFLTELLLENWTRDISLYEHYLRDFRGPLNSLIENHRGRINLKQAHFFDLWRLAYQDKHDNGTRLNNLLNIQQKPWGPEFCTTIIAICPTLAFIKHLTHSLVFQHSLMSLGRHQMFFVITPSQYVHLTCNREAGYQQYRNSAIMFQILFDFKFLCKLPRKSFLPWMIRPKHIGDKPATATQKFRELDPDHLYLMRMESRADLFDIIKLEDLKYLWYFIKHNCVSRSNRIIPNLERWIPNCGPRLINNPPAKSVPTRKTVEVEGFTVALESPDLFDTDYYPNMTIYTQFGDLTPSQLLTLFKQFRSWPEFSESYFVTSMENILLRIENSGEIIDDVDEELLNDEIPIEDP